MLDGNGKRTFRSFRYMTFYGPVEVVDVYEATQTFMGLTYLKGDLDEGGPYNRFARHLTDHARQAWRNGALTPEPVSFAKWRLEQPEAKAMMEITAEAVERFPPREVFFKDIGTAAAS